MRRKECQLTAQPTGKLGQHFTFSDLLNVAETRGYQKRIACQTTNYFSCNQLIVIAKLNNQLSN